MNAYTKATSEGAKVIILNLEGLEYMNSGGIGLLVTHVDPCEPSGADSVGIWSN